MTGEVTFLSYDEEEMEATYRFSFSIPMGDVRCPVCQRGPKIGEEFVVIVKAGSAWQDGRAELSEERAELYTIQAFCLEHAPPKLEQAAMNDGEDAET